MSLPQLKQQIASVGEAGTRVDLLWAVYQLGGLTDEYAGELLAHPNPHIRLWTVRLLADEKKVSPAVAYKLADLARTEPNIEVRSQLACSAKRLPADQALPHRRQPADSPGGCRRHPYPTAFVVGVGRQNGRGW